MPEKERKRLDSVERPITDDCWIRVTRESVSFFTGDDAICVTINENPKFIVEVLKEIIQEFDENDKELENA